MENNSPPMRVLKGVWIPAEIWNHHGLSWSQKCLWAEINAMGDKDSPCMASNRYLAQRMGSTDGSIANTISKFVKMGLVKRVSFDGRTRGIVAVND